MILRRVGSAIRETEQEFRRVRGMPALTDVLQQFVPTNEPKDSRDVIQYGAAIFLRRELIGAYLRRSGHRYPRAPLGKTVLTQNLTNRTHRRLALSEQIIHKNLVFEGGGTLIVLYSGAARALERRGVLQQVERVAGASTGSVMATMVALKMSAERIETELENLDWSRIPQKHDHEPHAKWSIKGELDKLTGGNFVSMHRLFSHYGFYSNTYFHEWLEGIVGSATGNPRATFAELRAGGYRDLHVIGSNVSKHTSEVFCADTTPDVAVADAVRISTAIPLFFEAVQFDGRKFGEGDYYTDGGFTDNYPLWIFDHAPYAKNNPYYIDDVNWETLGFYHFTPADIQQNKEITGLLSYIENLMATVARAKDLALRYAQVMLRRTVMMSDCGVGQTDFDMKPTDERYKKLFATGEEATEAFLNGFEPPGR